ncbi:HisA/HisF-related TIM barrel protein [Methylibium sp.]|uniref:HisA/HisF-related TIM barrel protein n=1 Tax=Methylibium sp. TaxID=2067992 RepID=UPI003D1027B4
MHIIPVIDLLGGQVVRAVRGDRQHYRPIESALCHSADPLTVASRLCEHCAIDTLYVADLDALQGRAPQVDTVAALLEARPALQLWLDAGFGGHADAERLLSRLGPSATRVTPVFGSESLRARDELARCFEPPSRALLSLDQRHGMPLDPAGVWDAPALWPQRLIVMTLSRVGSGGGPDLDTLAAVRTRAPQALLIGAGGVRDDGDLAAAEAAGAQAWLIASALHDGGLPARTRATAHRHTL